MVVVPPTNPVVSVGDDPGCAGDRRRRRPHAASVVGVSPIIGGAPVRGHGRQAAPRHRRRRHGAPAVGRALRGPVGRRSPRRAGSSTTPTRPTCRRSRRPASARVAVPLYMTDPDAAADLARHDVAARLPRARRVTRRIRSRRPLEILAPHLGRGPATATTSPPCCSALRPARRRHRRGDEQGGQQGRGPGRRGLERGGRDRRRGRPRSGPPRRHVIARDPARARAGRRRRRRLERRAGQRVLLPVDPDASAAGSREQAPRPHRHERRRSSSPTPRAGLAQRPDRPGDRLCRLVGARSTCPGRPTPTGTRWWSPRRRSPTRSRPPPTSSSKLAGRPVALLRGLGDLVLPRRRARAWCGRADPAQRRGPVRTRRPGGRGRGSTSD